MRLVPLNANEGEGFSGRNFTPRDARLSSTDTLSTKTHQCKGLTPGKIIRFSPDVRAGCFKVRIQFMHH
jgi:hypothetical protein